MADEKLTGLPVAASVDDTDLLYVVDVSDITDDPAGSSKQVTVSNALAGKSNTGHTHTESDITDLGPYADASHTHTASDVDAEASTDGQVLTSDGAGNAAWEDVAGTLADLSDTTITTPSDGDTLVYDGGLAKWVNETPVGGSGVITEIESITNPVSGEFDFNSIPSGYKRLVIKGTLRSDEALTADTLYTIFNTDTTVTNYHTQLNTGENGTNYAWESNNPGVGNCSGASAPAGAYSNFNLQMEDYDGSNIKSVSTAWSVMRTTSALDAAITAMWNTSMTAAVTRLRIRTDNHPTNKLVGTLTLYGES